MGRKKSDLTKYIDIVKTENAIVGCQTSEADIKNSAYKVHTGTADRIKTKLAKIEKALDGVSTLQALRNDLYIKLAIVSDPRYASIKGIDAEAADEKRKGKVVSFLRGLDAETLSALLAEAQK